MMGTMPNKKRICGKRTGYNFLNTVRPTKENNFVCPEPLVPCKSNPSEEITHDELEYITCVKEEEYPDNCPITGIVNIEKEVKDVVWEDIFTILPIVDGYGQAWKSYQE
jgi:hypothetical protein